jgi:hypothetical protein
MDIYNTNNTELIEPPTLIKLLSFVNINKNNLDIYYKIHLQYFNKQVIENGYYLLYGQIKMQLDEPITKSKIKEAIKINKRSEIHTTEEVEKYFNILQEIIQKYYHVQYLHLILEDISLVCKK